MYNVIISCDSKRQLTHLQVLRRVLPALQSLSEDEDAAVQRAAIDGLAQLLGLHSSNKELTSRLYSHLDELVTSNLSQVTVSDSKRGRCACRS